LVRGEFQFGNQIDAAPAGDRSIAPKASDGSISPLEAHAAFLSTLIGGQLDLTLDESVAAMHKQRIAGSRSAANLTPDEWKLLLESVSHRHYTPY
jgi:hypothetical protein